MSMRPDISIPRSRARRAAKRLALAMLHCAALVSILSSGWVLAVTPQGTAFTYQGLLKQDGATYNGPADVVFDLFDAAIGGVQVGPSLVFTAANGNPVAVQAGVFNVTLDFGPSVFNGSTSDQRFLRIIVNGNAVVPRTPVQSAPYALQSRTSELAYTVSNGAIGVAQIDQGAVQSRVSGTCTAGSSIRVVAANGSVTCQPDANSGGTITGITVGAGLSGGGNSGNVAVGLANPLTISGSTALGVVQANNAGNGNALRGTSASGTAIFGFGSTGTQGESNSAGGRGVVGYSSATTTSTIGVYGQADSPDGHGVGGYSPGGVGVFASSASGHGVQAISGSGTGLLALGANAVAPATSAAYGVFALTLDSSGAGVHGASDVTAGTGVRGSSAGNGATGVRGVATGVTGTGVSGSGSIGVSGSSQVASGIGVSGTGSVLGSTGVRGSSTAGIGVQGVSENNYGVRASATSYYALGAFTQTGFSAIYAEGTGVDSLGLFATGTGSNGTGVRGTSPNIGTAGFGRTGVLGDSSAANGFGVSGINRAGGSGVTWGVYGQTTSTGGYGVEGYNPNGIGVRGNGGILAGQFIGNVQVQGTLSKSAGSFQIDHPLDPANKYLYHSFVESPDMKNIYDGVATLDARGEAWVEMPRYFEALNREFRYQLTALDAPAPSRHVAKRIDGNRFKLAGGAPLQQVSWQVTGTRKDVYAESHRIEVEVDKPESQRGKYLHPALLGKSASLSVTPMTALVEAAPTRDKQPRNALRDDSANARNRR